MILYVTKCLTPILHCVFDTSVTLSDSVRDVMFNTCLPCLSETSVTLTDTVGDEAFDTCLSCVYDNSLMLSDTERDNIMFDTCFALCLWHKCHLK